MVTDAESGVPIPFVSVSLKGTLIGSETDFDGKYIISTGNVADTLLVSSIGFKPQKAPIKLYEEQTIDFVLEKEVTELDELVFEAGEDPAYPIMRQALKRKRAHDIRNIETYKTTNYTKLEFDVSDFPEKMRKGKLVQKAKAAVDTIGDFKTEDGSPIFPIFISESISETFVQNNPRKRHEDILKANIHGIGIDNKKQVAQITGVTFQEYNFYQNWLRIIDRDFVSPLADGWKTYYDYYLDDSTTIDGQYSYKILFYPKVEGDLAFEGHMWITKEDYALKQIDATVTGKANLNFIKSIHIYQELSPTDQTEWIPTLTDFELNVSEIASNFPGARAKFYLKTNEWELNQSFPNDIFLIPVEVNPDAVKAPPEFWDQVRPVPLDTSEMEALRAISAVERIKTVRVIAETIKTVRRGYVRSGKIDYGPWLFLYSNNNIEGNRVRFGFRTNDLFSERWVIAPYIAYGFRDERVKYGLTVDHIFTRKPWTKVTAFHRRDIEQLGVASTDDRTNFIFTAATRFGTLRSPHLRTESGLSFQRDLARGITQTISYKRTEFDPLFPFAFVNDPNADVPQLVPEYTTSEVIAETRFAKSEKYIFDNNRRFRVGIPRKPIFTLRYTLGIDGLFGSSFDYHKFNLRMDHTINVGLLGTGVYTLEGGYIPSTIPFPTLRNHVGNSTLFFNVDAFNLMEFGEFVSDRYVLLKYTHLFQGFILNRIPLMKKLKWRLVATGNILFGGISDQNLNLIPSEGFDENGEEIGSFRTLDNTPYVEVGYGIENIFKILRVTAFHRLTYLDTDADRFGVKLLFTIRP